VKRNGSQSNHPIAATSSSVRTRHHRDTPYQRVRDERKRPIRGLWIRNDRYYAQLTLEDNNTGQKRVRCVPLEGATTPAQARYKLEALLVDRRRGKSTPVVMGGQVWMTSATVDGHDFHAICVDADIGKIIYDEKVFHCENPEPLGNGAAMNCYATPSPAICHR
jgi:hypothetical protein